MTCQRPTMPCPLTAGPRVLETAILAARVAAPEPRPLTIRLPLAA